MDSDIEYRNCPCCGHDDFEVVFESNMKADDVREVVETVYMIPGDKHGRHVRCRNCHLIYVNPIEKTSRINRAYSQRKSTDACIMRRMRLRASRSQLELVDQRILHRNGLNLLDVGCGEGFFLSNASRAGYSVRGIELSEDAAEYARREFGLDVEAKPFEELHLPESQFDAVTLWQVLEHVPHPLAILREAHRILKPGGLLAVSTPDIGGAPARILGRRWWNIRMVHINQFTTHTMTTLLRKAGFRDISPVSYRESISILALFIPVLKYLKLYEPLRDLVDPGSVLGRGLNSIMLAYPSRLDNCTVVGFK